MNCRKNTNSNYPKVIETKNGRIILLSKCEVCQSKTLRLIKEQEANGILFSLGIKIPFSKNPLVGLDFLKV